MYRAIRKVPYVIILIALVLTIALYPFMTKINSVVSSNESSLLPKNVESIKVMNIVDNSTNSTKETNVVYIISNVTVNSSSFYRLNSTLMKLNLSNSISWISLLNSAYSLTLNKTNYMLNSSLELANGIKSLWINVNNLSKKLYTLQNNIFLLSQLIRNADYIYSNYNLIGNNLSNLVNNTRYKLILLGNATNQLSNYYTALYFNVIRIEFYLENKTNAYETYNLTENDIYTVINNSPQIYNISSPSPSLVEFVYYNVLKNGGPSEFNNEFASNLTYELLEKLNNTSSNFTEILSLYHIVYNNISSKYPNLKYILYENPSIIGQYNLLSYINNISKESSIVTFDSLVKNYINNEKELEIIFPIASQYALSNFNNSKLNNLFYNSTINILSSFKVPKIIAENLSYYIVENEFNKEVASVNALNTIILYMPKNVSLINSNIANYISKILIIDDPNADGLLYNNVTYSNIVASNLIGNLFNVSNKKILLELADNYDPNTVAIQVINQTLNSTLARTLLNEIAINEPIKNYSQLILLMPSMLYSILSNYGIPSNLTGLVINSTMKVFLNETSYSIQLDYITKKIFNETINNITNKIVGTLIQNDKNGFIIFLPSNLSYKAIINLENNLSNTLISLGYKDTKVMVTGNQVLNYQLANSSLKSISQSDTISTILVLIILAIVLESIVAIFLPFVGIGMGLIIALGVAYILAKGDIISLNSISRTIMYLAGLGLGIDYSSLISRRFREEFSKVKDARIASENALRRSWRAVITGGLTAAIGFGSMSIASNFPFLSSLGESIPIAILITMTISLTVIPSLLAILGGKKIIWWPSKLNKPNNKSKSNNTRYNSLLKHQAIILAIVIIILIPSIYVYVTFSGSYDFSLMMPQNSQSVVALHYLTNNYQSGLLYPDYIVAPNISTLNQINQSIYKLSCVKSTQLLNSSKPILEVVLSEYPLGKQAIACTETIRSIAKNVSQQAMVGGMPAINLDLKNIVYHSFYHLVYPIAIILMFIVLLIFYESVPMALIALGSVVFSAIFGSALSIEIYKMLNITLPWYLPIVVFTAILGVGMDYNSFIINRMKEECELNCSKEAIINTLNRMSILVIGLSIIMAGAFSGLLAFSAPGFRGMGLALMTGVLLAGFMASLFFTPLLANILGKYAWWPKKIKKS